MKTFFLTLALLGTFSAAQASPLAEKSQRITSFLMTNEDKLTTYDHRDVDNLLQNLEVLLSKYGSGSNEPKLICVSNGSSGSFEKFSVYNFSKKVNLGGETSKERCYEVIARKNLGLLCVSNGSSGTFEAFTPFDYPRNVKVGGETSLETCLLTVQKAKKEVLCVSNGSRGTFEKFSLFDRNDGKIVGGETSLENCLDSLP